MKLGVCYYPEHWSPERWSTDARMMREAGLSIVRVAEFAWQKMEPEEGEFTFKWLDTAIETLHADGLQVVLGTPTPTPPALLCAAHPDILPVDANGRRRRFGSRRHYCSNQPVYHEHTRRIVRAMAERYGKHPAVIGWQTDNEFGCHDTARCYCDTCAQKFREWLKARYETLDELNKAWGTVFWSQAYNNWDEIQPPNSYRGIFIVFFLAFVLGSASCPQEGTAEKAGQKVDQAAESGSKKIEKAGEAVVEKVEKAGEYIDDAAITARSRRKF